MRPMLAPIALLFAVMAPAAFAQEPISDLRAWNLGEGLVALSFTYQGGACDRTLQPTVAPEAVTAAIDVVVPMIVVGEMCTMQIVPVPFTGIVTVPEGVTLLDVSVENADGESIAAGSIEVPVDEAAEGGRAQRDTSR